MIPNIIHFIYGLEENFGGKSFSYLHHLAIISAYLVNKPDKIYFHYQYDPKGIWWDKSKLYVTLNKYIPRDEIFGNKIINYAHKADIARLEILKKYGGIYLDIDVICINSFQPLLINKCVLGREENTGLCNAVILAEKNAQFLSIWLNSYKTFDHKLWNEHSVKLPLKLANENRKLVHIENEYAFFYPMYNDLVSEYLWNKKEFSNITKLKYFLIKIRDAIVANNFFKTPYLYFHVFFNSEWHEKKLNKSYCIHLWESLWWEKYLKNITPETLKQSSNNFSRIIKKKLKEL